MTILAESPPQRRKVILTERRNGHPKALDSHRKYLEDGTGAVAGVNRAQASITDGKLFDSQIDPCVEAAYDLASAEYARTRYLPFKRIADELERALTLDPLRDIYSYDEPEAALVDTGTHLNGIVRRAATTISRAGA